MQKSLLLFFYLLVGITNIVCIFTAIYYGYPVISAWLLISALINFALFYIVWRYSPQGEGKNRHRYKHLRVVK